MCGDASVANLALSAMRKVEGWAHVAADGDGVVHSSNNKNEEKADGVKQYVRKERHQQVGRTVRGQKRKKKSVDQMTDVSPPSTMRRERNVEGVLQFHANSG